MTIEEAKNRGCPHYIIDKFKSVGIASYEVNTGKNTNWKKVEKLADEIIRTYMAKNTPLSVEVDEPILTRWEILDL